MLRRGGSWREDELVLLYSGNMGLGHRFGEFLAAADRLNEGPGGGAGVRMVFTGAGKRRAEIERYVDERPGGLVELGGYVPRPDLAVHLASADVHLVSLDPSWTGTMVPSKLQGIFAVGRPVIFLGSPESSIGQWIGESQAGWVVEPEDIEGILEAVEDARDPDERRGRRPIRPGKL